MNSYYNFVDRIFCNIQITKRFNIRNYSVNLYEINAAFLNDAQLTKVELIELLMMLYIEISAMPYKGNAFNILPSELNNYVKSYLKSIKFLIKFIQDSKN